MRRFAVTTPSVRPGLELGEDRSIPAQHWSCSCSGVLWRDTP